MLRKFLGFLKGVLIWVVGSMFLGYMGWWTPVVWMFWTIILAFLLLPSSLRNASPVDRETWLREVFWRRFFYK